MELTKEEWDYLRRLLKRLSLEAERNPERMGEAQTKVVNRLVRTFDKDVDFKLALTRVHKRFIQGLIKSAASALERVTIPGYEERAKKDPVKYSAYLERARERREMVSGLAKKLEDSL